MLSTITERLSSGRSSESRDTVGARDSVEKPLLPPMATKASSLDEQSFAYCEQNSLLQEIDNHIQPSDLLISRLKRLYPTVNFDVKVPIVLPAARDVEPWRSPEEWKIRASHDGARIVRGDMRSLALYASADLANALLEFVKMHGRHACILGCSDHVEDRKGGLALLQTRLVLE